MFTRSGDFGSRSAPTADEEGDAEVADDRRSRKTRIAFNAVSAAIATVVGVLLVQHFRTEGWPLSGAKVNGVILASVLLPARLRAQGARLEAAVRPERATGADGARRGRRGCVRHRHRASRPLRRARARRGRPPLSGLVRRRRRRLPLTPAPRPDRQCRPRAARGNLSAASIGTTGLFRAAHSFVVAGAGSQRP